MVVSVDDVTKRPGTCVLRLIPVQGSEWALKVNTGLSVRTSNKNTKPSSVEVRKLY